jgi:hypothetical protein
LQFSVADRERSRRLVERNRKGKAMEMIGTVRVQFVPVGRHRREWMWKARDESNTITISGQRFDSLGEAVRDARTQMDISHADDGDDGPYVA